MSDAKVKVTLKMSLGEFAAYLQALADVARAATAAFSGFFRAFGRRESLEARRIRFGGMAEDLRRWPDRWQTLHCAAMLHGDCPNERHALGCTCRCHAS